ncbi:MAG: FkbM family methyltransferase [Tepidisphaeraceae bacterium]
MPSKSSPHAWTPRIATLDAIEPGCRFHVGSGTENFRITRYGGEQEFVREIVDAVKPGEIFFDIGTCVGLVAIHAAKRGARVIAFEPEPTFRSRLRENLALNGMEQMQVIEWAVSDRKSTATLYTDGAHGNSPSLTAADGRGAIRIETGTIDAAVEAGLLPVPHVVKMDIEGAEVRALHGMQGVLRRPDRPRTVFIEVHPNFLARLGDAPGEIHAILSAAGYVMDYERVREEQVHQRWHAR